MSEKIDLEDLADMATWPYPPVDASELLALVAAVRAAMTYARSGHVADRLALDAALAHFTDSAEAS